jgi:hypothetical protein
MRDASAAMSRFCDMLPNSNILLGQQRRFCRRLRRNRQWLAVASALLLPMTFFSQSS